MSYLKEIQTQINNRDFSKFMQLWEEYCTSDSVDVDEFEAILKAIKNSDFAKPFGQYVETALPLLELMPIEEERYRGLRLLVDLQTLNNPKLGDLALEALRKKYGQTPQFNERLRLVGLRGRENYQGAVSNFDLLYHSSPGNFVYHSGGWGAGEIMEVSSVREQIVVEFENVSGRKHITFANAFKTLVPLSKEHFLARRFSDPDNLEKDAKENPVEVIKILLRDLGPRTASEIKDDLAELVIPEEEWQKWWQNARARLKKDTFISSPENLRESFALRSKEISHEDQFYQALKNKKEADEILIACYSFIRDHTARLKSPEVKQVLQDSLKSLINDEDLSDARRLQALFSLESVMGVKQEDAITKIIQSIENVEDLIEEIEILAYKKQALIVIQQKRKDWQSLFLKLFLFVSQGPLRDFLLKELNQSDAKPQLEEALKELIAHPSKQPELLIWYFQKILEGKDTIPYASKQGRMLFMESFLLLLHQLENRITYKELTRKMYAIFSAKRYAIVRKILESSDLEFAKEFLLLASKCHTFSNHDLKILHSLAEVVHPSLKVGRIKEHSIEDLTVWTSEEGYFKTQERIKQIGTKEMVDNAREIEAARALGDLRENMEYKYALEKRSQLQRELKALSDQFGKARIVTPDDVHVHEVGVGSIVEVTNKGGAKTSYTLLGPWDADPEKNILSLQSKLAQSMLNLKKGETFTFKAEEYTITDLKSIFD